MYGQFMLDLESSSVSVEEVDEAVVYPLDKPERLKNIRIAVISDAAPHRNGVGAYYNDLSQHMQLRGMRALVNISPMIVDGKWSGGVKFPLPGDSTQKFIIPNPVRLWIKIRQINPDLVIIPTPGLYGLVGALIAKFMNIKVIVGFHTWYEKLTELYWKHWQGVITKGYFRVSNKILFQFSQSVVVNSDFMRDTVAELGAENIDIVGTPISFEFIYSHPKRYSGELKKIVFVGRLAAEKNIDAIIDAAERHPQLQFSIAGDGPEKHKVESAASRLNNLEFLGWLRREELLTTLDETDMLVLPSYVESFGTVAMEAMARQKLVLVSQHCGIAQWSRLKTGLMFIRQDENLSNAIDRVQLDGIERRRYIAEQARACAVSLNQWSVERWYQLFSKLISESEHASPCKHT